MEEQLYDFKNLEKVCAGDSNFMNDMIDLFIATTPKNIKEMSKCLEERDFKAVSECAHKMKPSLNYIGISRLYDEVRLIENWNESNDEMTSKALHFINEINLLLSQLAQVRNSQIRN